MIIAPIAADLAALHRRGKRWNARIVAEPRSYGHEGVKRDKRNMGALVNDETPRGKLPSGTGETVRVSGKTFATDAGKSATKSPGNSPHSKNTTQIDSSKFLRARARTRSTWWSRLVGILATNPRSTGLPAANALKIAFLPLFGRASRESMTMLQRQMVMIAQAMVVAVLLLAAPLCAAPTQETSIEKTTYRGFEAFRLSDGRSEAVVVPAMGRVMRFGLVGSFNWLWNLPEADARAPKPYRNWRDWGGDKTWIAPQSQWLTLAGRGWPPDSAWGNPSDGPHHARIVGNALRVEGPVSRASGLQISRQYRFENGEFLIAQTVSKKSGPPLIASIWSDTTIGRPEAIFVLSNPQSPYRGGFYVWPRAETQPDAPIRTQNLLEFQPARGASIKRGLDSPIAAIAAFKNRQMFVQRAAKPAGNYPDGAPGAGFPLEIFDTGDKTKTASQCLELELLSPLRFFRFNSKWTHTVRWYLQSASSSGPPSPREWIDLLSKP